MKSTPDEIRRRFDGEVERFSNLETGQSATVDAPLVLELISQAAAAVAPEARCVLDVGCGAGNYSLKLLSHLPGLDVTLVDLSQNMLDRARERVGAATTGAVEAIQGDVRGIDLGEGRFDIIVAAAVLHHLRTDDEWRAVFAAFHRALRPGGSLWVSDLMEHEHPAVQTLMRRRWGDYLAELGGGGAAGEAHRRRVFNYIEQEDTPRPFTFQLDLLREVGFAQIDVLHKNAVFAAYGAVKR